MKHIVAIIMMSISFSVFSQSNGWTTESSKDGASIVKYKTVKEEAGTHIYYIAQRNVNATLEELDAYFSNSANHKNFLESTPVSDEVKKVSENQWLTFYYFDAPWPLPKSDVVAQITRTQEENKLVFTAAAIANDYKKDDAERLSQYKFIYEFEKIDESTSKITINADYIPKGSIPTFLINTWFPEGPAKIVSKLGKMQ